MSNRERNIDILERITGYCLEVKNTQSYFGNSFEVFSTNSIYRNAISLCLLQIGELSNHLSEEFKERYNEIPWRNIKGLRNIVAHQYESVNTRTLWETVTQDVPMLHQYCNGIIENYRVLEQDSIENDNEDEYEH
ncbi:HepT-like ribonuclease domain-containing protein [Desulfitobacterium hafniense]|uniref:HepT-like ribonuclease domain-containing protein n=1 Tax=Desulfitobacterium hafniense TaxID=49338 RepID=UPI000371135A|nr:HepT-like ribonuclease domain-containing protein [Desulfitobacterium hafniense]